VKEQVKSESEIAKRKNNSIYVELVDNNIY